VTLVCKAKDEIRSTISFKSFRAKKINGVWRTSTKLTNNFKSLLKSGLGSDVARGPPVIPCCSTTRRYKFSDRGVEKDKASDSITCEKHPQPSIFLSGIQTYKAGITTSLAWFTYHVLCKVHCKQTNKQANKDYDTNLPYAVYL
jgi:hypothetical protein